MRGREIEGKKVRKRERKSERIYLCVRKSEIEKVRKGERDRERERERERE